MWMFHVLSLSPGSLEYGRDRNKNFLRLPSRDWLDWSDSLVIQLSASSPDPPTKILSILSQCFGLESVLDAKESQYHYWNGQDSDVKGIFCSFIPMIRQHSMIMISGCCISGWDPRINGWQSWLFDQRDKRCNNWFRYSGRSGDSLFRVFSWLTIRLLWSPWILWVLLFLLEFRVYGLEILFSCETREHQTLTDWIHGTWVVSWSLLLMIPILFLSTFCGQGGKKKVN